MSFVCHTREVDTLKRSFTAESLPAMILNGSEECLLASDAVGEPRVQGHFTGACGEANVQALQQSRKGSDSKEAHLPALHEPVEKTVAGHENQDAVGDNLAGLQEGLPHRILPHTYH